MDINFLLNEKILGCDKNGVKLTKIAMELAPMQDREKIKDAKWCKETIDKIQAIIGE